MSKTKIIWTVIAAAFAYDATVAYKNKKKFETLREDRQRVVQLCNLYATMLKDHGIRPDEFEYLIIKELTSK